MSKEETIALTNKQKWEMYLIRPLLMSMGSFILLHLLEGGIPNPNRMIGITIGFFIGSVILMKFFPDLAMNKGTKHPTKKQKVGRIVLYTLVYGFLLFAVVRFLIRL
ncbi:hypothetical protein RYX56_16915 [Alkalihalophilus lindianensis]|uniref:Uncharacterized protein n=1 Tax=Alkalihalophilus lindianensis TaxID=1630542 RepID=A0ABU3XDT3_9BACI|nr:hypothetical protein [Alkalihalophilus lindianensis]MDV2686051.1 hypothetical protein [Alkalihalophilus lindianensis]